MKKSHVDKRSTDKLRNPERTRSKTLAESDRAVAGKDRDSRQTRNTRNQTDPFHGPELGAGVDFYSESKDSLLTY